jgi:acetate kinase
MSTAQSLKEQFALFRDFSDDRLQELINGSKMTTFQPNQTVVRMGEDASFFGLLLEGELAAWFIEADGRRTELGRFKAGDTFGEGALMTGAPFIADFVALTACRVLAIPVRLFQSIVVAEPRAVQRIAATVAERFRKLMEDPAKAAAALRQSEDVYGLNLKSDRPEKVLVINSGSSSVKYSFFDTANPEKRARGQVERIGQPDARIAHYPPGGAPAVKRQLAGNDYGAAFQAVLEELTRKETGVLTGAGDVTLVVHRVVHGGERFSEATVITDEVLQQIEALNPLAPLHNPVNVAGIRETRRVFPGAPHVAAFDTAYHHTLPPYAYLYGLPYEFYEKKGVRRYGFHGSSHAFVGLRAAQYLKRRPGELRLVSCHLGNGSSVCAVEHGRSIDTSMGFTPGEGLIMGTRCGDVDSGALTFLEQDAGLSVDQISDMLNKRSGLLGLSGISSDMRELEQAADNGNARALLTLKTYAYRVRKYIGAYAAAMGGLDVIVFTGGIGQGSAGVRAEVLQGLRCMAIVLDESRNREARGFDEVCRISADDSPVIVLVVPTEEERMMARDALRAVARTAVTRALSGQRQQPILVEVSAHHVHLAQEHVEALFGKGHQLTRRSDLSQPGQFACEEQVTLVGPKGRIERVRVLGPVRKATQVEIAMTEQFKLGIHPPIRESGDIANTPGCTLEGTAGSVVLNKGVICAMRHVHMTPEDALRYGVRDKSVVRIRVAGDRELIFGDVLVRVNPASRLAMHIDTDEGNAANLQTGAQGLIDGIQSSD